MFEQIKRANFLVISHYSKKSLEKFLKIQAPAGPAKGMFNTLLKFGFEKKGAVKNKKITNQEAQKLLDKYFKQDLTSVYAEINKFREGVKSLEVYSS